MRNVMFIVSLIGILGSSCSRIYYGNIDLDIEQKLSFSDSLNLITIRNNEDQPFAFKIKINNLFPLDMGDVIQHITDIASNEKTPLEEIAWRYVTNKTFHSAPYTEQTWQHSPELFLNSIGGGYCDDRASVLAKIWEELGFESRIVGLNGHVVPEVNIDEKWKMYDPDEGVFYLNTDGTVCSVSDLQDHPDWILTPEANRVVALTPLARMTFKNEASQKFSNFYKSVDDNHVADLKAPLYITDNVFILPSYSTVKFYLSRELGSTMSVSLMSKSKGNLMIPLVPYYFKGKWKARVNEEEKSKDELNPFDFREDYISNVEIIRTYRNTEMKYLINPMLDFLNSMNDLEFYSNVELIVSGSVFKRNSDKLFYNKDMLLWQKEIEKNKSLSEKIAKVCNKKIGASELKDLFRCVLQADSKLKSSTRKKIFDTFTTHVLPKLNAKDYDTLNRNLPESILLFFFYVRNTDPVQAINFIRGKDPL